MASCLVTIGGSSGEVLIKYTLGGLVNTITASYGTIQYIDDAAIDITSQTLSGNATASSACLTITALVVACYLYHWESIGNNNQEANNMVFDAIDFNNVITLLTESLYTDGSGYITLASNITDLADSRIVVMSGKREITVKSSINNYMILKISGPVIPLIRIKNPLYSHYLYLKGELQANCTTPLNYLEYNNCINNPL